MGTLRIYFSLNLPLSPAPIIITVAFSDMLQLSQLFESSNKV
jgi:hypothetical protein